jgi:PAS domain S-box-containing protein
MQTNAMKPAAALRNTNVAAWRERAAGFVLVLLVVLALAAWVRGDWLQALSEARTEFENLAQTNALAFALEAGDVRRTHESIDAALGSGRAPTAELLRAELRERFRGAEVVDYLPPRPALPSLSTASQPLDREALQHQLQRVLVTGRPVFGWAYLRGQVWMLPVFFQRKDGSVLVVSLPTEPLLARWVTPSTLIEKPVGLRGYDDRILLRQPFTPQMMGASAAGSPSALAIRSALERGRGSGSILTRATETDHVERLIAWAAVPGSSVKVMVAGSQKDLLAHWWRQRAASYLLTGFLLVVTGAFFAWSRRRLGAHAQAERAARQVAEQGLQTLQRMCLLAKIGPWSVDVATGALQMGPGAREVYGLDSRVDVGSWNTFQGADAESMPALTEARRQLLADGAGYDLLLPVRTPSGEQRWVRSTASAVRSASGRIERIDGALQDVTESVLNRQQLSASDRRLRELAQVVSSSAQLLLITDAEQKITWCNAAFERVSGYSLAEIAGRTPGPLLQRNSAPAATRETLRKAIAERRPVHGVRMLNISKAGRPYWIDLEISPVFDSQGELHGFIGLQTDVTADIERQRELKQEQERNELATRNARIGIFERDFVSRATRWNAMMFELTDFPDMASPPLAAEVEQRIPPEHRAATIGALRRALRDSTLTSLDFECPFAKAEGGIRWLRHQCVIERDASGKAQRLVGTLLDVTLERALGDERRARAEAEARSAAKTAFLSSMNHELRTPLNAVIGYAQIVGSDPSDDAVQLRARVSRIESAGWHLLALIDDILDLARIEAGTAQIELTPVALHEVVADAADLVASQAEARQIRMSVEASEVLVMGDARRLRQVVVNLLSNAIKYNVEGGVVEVGLVRLGSHAQVQVKDSGLGMTSAQVGQLFQPFNRLGREASHIQGTGIGLTITKTLVEQMNGSLGVRSEAGRGSTFEMQVPLALNGAVPMTRPAKAGRQADSDMSSLTVLCIEDNDVNALVLEESIKLLRPRWAVLRVESLEAATRAMRTQPVDVVVLDQNLPDGQGLDWWAGQQAIGRQHPVRVVLMTADAMPGVADAAAALGVEHLIHKPFDLAVFEALLQDVAISIAQDARSATSA